MAMLKNQMAYIVATKYNITHKHRNYTHTQIYMNVHACVHTTITGNYNNNTTKKNNIYLIAVTTNTNSNKHYIYMYIIVCICIYIYVNVLVFNQVHIPLLSLIMVCKSRARVVLRSLSLVQSYLSPTSFY